MGSKEDQLSLSDKVPWDQSKGSSTSRLRPLWLRKRPSEGESGKDSRESGKDREKSDSRPQPASLTRLGAHVLCLTAGFLGICPFFLCFKCHTFISCKGLLVGPPSGVSGTLFCVSIPQERESSL